MRVWMEAASLSTSSLRASSSSRDPTSCVAPEGGLGLVVG